MILDTSFLLDVRRGDSGAIRLASQLDSDHVYQRVSSITVAELFAGVPRSPNPEKEQQNIISVVLSKEVVPIDERIAQRAGRLHGERYNDGTPVEMHDCLIAATAIDFEEPVVTRNVDHFERFADVAVREY